MLLPLDNAVTTLPRIGPVFAKDLEELGIFTLRDLVLHLPFRYEDFSRLLTCVEARVGDRGTWTGEIGEVKTTKGFGKRRGSFRATLRDASGVLTLCWFGAHRTFQPVKIGQCVTVSGEVARLGLEKGLVHPMVHKHASDTRTKGPILPIYHLSGSLTQGRMRAWIERARMIAAREPEMLPMSFVETLHLRGMCDGLRCVHDPTDLEEVAKGQQRLAAEELFEHFFLLREGARAQRGTPYCVERSVERIRAFVARLGFTLTDTQKQVIWESLEDLNKDTPMNRLIQGDVGSGKTVVAAAIFDHLFQQKELQIAYVVPTEILAKQQAEALRAFLDEPVALLTSKMAALNGVVCSREVVLQGLREGTIRLVVGTHALFEPSCVFRCLGAVCIDEQHRFGVEARHALLARETTHSVHLLTLSATPIPRTLALTLYGNLDLSRLTSKPPGRPVVETRVVIDPLSSLKELILAHVERQERVYVICPLIEEGEEGDETNGQVSVESVQKKLRLLLKKVDVAVLHGRLASPQKQEVLERFSDGRSPVLVSTTVVEVGVHVPEATLLLVLDAHRFGISQLHQLRGRIGRSARPSSCVLITTPEYRFSPRLRALEECSDGFMLAERDLALRGAGALLGQEQSGGESFRCAAFVGFSFIESVRRLCKSCFESPNTTAETAVVRQRIEHRKQEIHLE